MFHRKNQLSAAAALLVTSLAATGQADITVRFVPPEEIVSLGTLFTMDIVADLPDPVLAWGFDLTIADPSIVSLVGGPAIGSSWLPTFTPDGDGLGGLAFPTGVSGAGVLLATVTFSADALGETDLFLSVTAGDVTEGFGLDPTGLGEVVFEAGHIRVVPAPAALLLGALGLGMVAWLKRSPA